MPSKVMSLVLLEQLQSIIKPQLMQAQCGFRQGCSTVDQIWVFRQVIEKATEYTILEETGELPMEVQLRQRQLQWLGHVQIMSDY